MWHVRDYIAEAAAVLLSHVERESVRDRRTTLRIFPLEFRRAPKIRRGPLGSVPGYPDVAQGLVESSKARLVQFYMNSVAGMEFLYVRLIPVTGTV